MPVSSGRRDEVLRIFAKDPNDAGKTDDNGDPLSGEVTLIEEYHCSIQGQSLREIVNAGGETPRQRFIVKGLYDPTITETALAAWEVGISVRVYEIENVEHIRDIDVTRFIMSWAKS